MRDRIYVFAMGGNTSHVVEKSSQGEKGYDLKLSEPNDSATALTPEAASRFAIGHSFIHGDASDRLALAFLQTSKQAHCEAALVPFTHNSFVLYHDWFGPSLETKDFLSKTMPAQRRAIRDVQFRFNQGIPWRRGGLSASFASQFPNMTELSVVLPCKKYVFNVPRLLKYLDKVKPWPLKTVRVLLPPDDRPGDRDLDTHTKAAIQEDIERAEGLGETMIQWYK